MLGSWTFVDLLALFGVVVGAVSGVLSSSRKRLDILGVFVVALVTSLGGGTLRDLLMGRPAFWLAESYYVWVVLLVTLCAVAYGRAPRDLGHYLLLADALVLAFFTVLGAETAYHAGLSPIAVALMGACTGAAGGALRDLLLNEVPVVLTGGTLYATAALAGGVLYPVLHAFGAGTWLAGGLSLLLVLGLRVAAIYLKIKLPPLRAPAGKR